MNLGKILGEKSLTYLITGRPKNLEDYFAKASRLNEEIRVTICDQIIPGAGFYYKKSGPRNLLFESHRIACGLRVGSGDSRYLYEESIRYDLSVGGEREYPNEKVYKRARKKAIEQARSLANKWLEIAEKRKITTSFRDKVAA